MIASLILFLYFQEYITLDSAYTSLYIAGVFLIIAEIGIVSFGILTLNGLLALYAAFALHMGHQSIFGLEIGWPLMLGITFIELICVITIIAVHMKLRSITTKTGTESMIGQKATVMNWDGEKGTIRFEGEIWKAESHSKMDLKENDIVTIEEINKLIITVTA